MNTVSTLNEECDLCGTLCDDRDMMSIAPMRVERVCEIDGVPTLGVSPTNGLYCGECGPEILASRAQLIEMHAEEGASNVN
jgi:hypothetical protein